MSSVSSNDTDDDDATASQEGDHEENQEINQNQNEQRPRRQFDPSRDWDRLSQITNQEIIAEFESFYEFLQHFYVPAEIQYPPLEGWPNITNKCMEPFNKSDRVIDLLRHLPYLENQCDGHGWEIAPSTYLVNYEYALQGDMNDYQITRLRESTIDRTAAIWNDGRTYGPDTIGFSGGDRESSCIALDVKHGLIYWEDRTIIHGIRSTWLTGKLPPGVDEHNESDEEPQRYWPCWPVEDFFDLLKGYYRDLQLLPNGSGMMIEMTDVGDTEEDDKYGEVTMRNIYKKWGWPSKDFDTAGCRKEIEDTGW